MQLQKYCSKGEVGQTSHPCTFPRAFSTEFKYNQSSDPLNTRFLFYGYPTDSLDASHDPSTGRFPNRSRSPMQYAAFDRGCQFQYHIGKRSEPRVSAPDENRQRQRKIKAGCVRDAVFEKGREREPREEDLPSRLKPTQRGPPSMPSRWRGRHPAPSIWPMASPWLLSSACAGGASPSCLRGRSSES